jgi:predicted ATPase
LADLQRRTGKLDDASQTLDDALAIVALTHNRYYEAELLRLKGELLLQKANEQAAAESCFRQSLDVARAQQARGWELRSALSLTRLLQKQDKTRRDLLAPIHALFTEGHATPDLIDAKALVDAL